MKKTSYKIAMLAPAWKRHTHMWCRWLVDHGHEVVLLSDVPPAEDMDYSGIRVRQPQWSLLQNLVTYKLRGGPFANNRDKWKVYAPIIREERPDILHAQEALGYGPTLGRLPAFPRVLTPWGPDIERLGEGGEAEALIQQAVAAADVIATNGPNLENDWARLTGQPADKFRMFSWGVDLGVFHRRPESEQSEVRRLLGIGETEPFLLSPRLANRYYRIVDLIASWKRVRDGLEEASRFRLAIMRAGAQDEDWSMVKDAAAGEDSIVLSEQFLSHNQMAAAYSAARGVVMIPETDLLAMSLLECVACGALPVTAPHAAYLAAVRDIEESHEERANAIILQDQTEVALDDAITRWMLLPDESLPRIAEENARYAQDFQDRGRCLARINEVYAEARELFLARAL